MDSLPAGLDFNCESSLIYRLQHGGGYKKQAIARAVGANPDYQLQVIDATCGFGTDALVLAYFNCKVYAIEQNPTVAKLTHNRFCKFRENQFLAPIIKNITLFTGNALQILPKIFANNQPNWLPDAIYLDPMFQKKTHAAPHKLMQLLQSIVKPDAGPLLEFCLKYPVKRIVVKRPRVAPYLENFKPTFSLKGKANRFDIYLSP